MVFFTASDGVHGRELWKSDGTSDGTSLVKDINLNGDALHDYPYRSQPYYSSMVVMNDTLFFTATNGQSGMELWKSDGTDGGTLLVKDINKGQTGSWPYGLTTVQN